MRNWDWMLSFIIYNQKHSRYLPSRSQEVTRDPTLSYDDEDEDGKTHGIMSTGIPRRSTWRDGFSRMTLHWRINDLRHLGIFALLAFSISLLLFEAHRQVIGISNNDVIDAIEKTPQEDPEPNAGGMKVPGQCTTWPVSAKGVYKPKPRISNLALQSFAPPGGWKKPEGITIKALVFYGRKRTVDFLDCYLQQNLAVNGGYLDEVWFMVHTDIGEDLSYLDTLIEKRGPQYRVIMPGECQGFNYACMWNPVVEDNTIYVKIDDDIVSENPPSVQIK